MFSFLWAVACGVAVGCVILIAMDVRKIRKSIDRTEAAAKAAAAPPKVDPFPRIDD